MPNSRFTGSFFKTPGTMTKKMKALSFKGENVKENTKMSILDLPISTLECILERLPPDGLCNMAAVCTSLRDICRSDHLWGRLFKEKWGKLIGPAAYRKWQWYISLRNESGPLEIGKHQGLVESLACVWSLSWIKSKVENDNIKPKNSLQVNSIMSLYLSLESGKFWFPAQHSHTGFMLSCYDAEVRYDHMTDTFHARYPPHEEWKTVIDEIVEWDRLRSPPVDTAPHDLYVSDCLSDLFPGDHIEVQWREKGLPYGWWYGVVGHLESCTGNQRYCRCHNSDTVIVVFKQFSIGSPWRQAVINKEDPHEQGNNSEGFYGGIRKLYNKEEISIWKKFWVTEIFE